MLSVKTDEKTPKAIPNILPCRIHHNGPIAPVADYWNPTSADGIDLPSRLLPPSVLANDLLADKSKVSYFRGRKLQGKSIKLPEQCRGVVMERTTDETPPAETVDPIEDGDDASERVGTMKVTGEFDEVVVWGHEVLGDAAGDPYIRSMEEWLHVAERVCKASLTLIPGC